MEPSSCPRQLTRVTLATLAALLAGACGAGSGGQGAPAGGNDADSGWSGDAPVTMARVDAGPATPPTVTLDAATIPAPTRDGGPDLSSPPGRDAAADASAGSADTGGPRPTDAAAASDTAPPTPPGPVTAGADRDGWRTFHGSWSHLAGKPSGRALVDSLQKARRLWKGDEPIGHPKDSVAGAASPVVADGSVFQVYLTASSDVAVALDVATGKMRWKKTFDGGRGAITGGAFYATPAVFAGTLVMVGGKGRLYGLDVTDGRLLWETQLPAKLDGANPFNAGISYAGGVALVPGYDPSPAGQSLHGFDPRTGQKLWTVPVAVGARAMALRWIHEGRDLAIASNEASELRALDPRTGQAVWMQKGVVGASESSPAVGDGYLVGNTTASGGEFVKLAAFKLGADGATKIWDYPDGTKYSYVAILDKHAYINLERNNSGEQEGEGLVVVDLDGARILKRIPIQLRSRAILWAGDGRVVFGHDGSHGLERYVMASTAPEVRQFHADWVGLPVPVGQGFIYCLSQAYVDGVVYLRGTDAVYALDMRAP